LKCSGYQNINCRLGMWSSWILHFVDRTSYNGFW